jgi:protein-S-isoprenylcysteine O-methyltransferase Ste14
MNAPLPQQAPDTPGVLVLPPLLALADLVFGLLLDDLLPIGFVTSLPFLPRVVLGAILLALGFSMAKTARASFLAAGTNVNPMQPTVRMVTSGYFSHVRNPMYQGWTLVLIGVALMTGSDWMFLLLIPCLLTLHYGVVLREERYLERKFGEPYELYKASVPRYGWKV